MRVINKDILLALKQGEIDYLLHQCNCVGLNGAGIAKQIVKTYPQVDKDNKAMFGQFGQYSAVQVNSEPYRAIVNLYTQYYIGSPSNKVFMCEYEISDNFKNRSIALRKALKQFRTDILSNKIPQGRVGLPLIASGLAADKQLLRSVKDNLEYFKTLIYPIVEEELYGLEVSVYIV